MQRRLKLVLDTNIVLDWLVFDDPELQPLQNAIDAKQVEALTHTPAMAELTRVLAYPQLKLDGAQQTAVLTAYRRYSVAIERSEISLPPGFPQCRDPDDQHFLALAHQERAALVSRDKAVLALRRRAARFGLHIVDVAALGRLLAERVAEHADT